MTRNGIFAVVLAAWAALGPGTLQANAQSFSATTTVSISVCGNGIVEAPTEVCDDGKNTGLYSTSTVSRQCATNCLSWAPYCGDGILQPYYGEQCDDGNNTGGDGCSATCQIESTASQPGPAPSAPSGPYPGGQFSPQNPTTVIVQGKAYPGASVNILKDGATLGVVQADSNANFYFTTTNVAPGVATFGIWAQDANGLKSIALTTTFTITANTATTISGEFLPPTIAIDKRQLQRGEVLTISGQSVPSVTIEAHVHSGSELTVTTSTDEQGNWKVPVDTTGLDNNAFHTVSANFVTTANGATVKSVISQAISFYVGSRSIGKSFLSDLNGDGKVNLADFSILLYYWGTSSQIADLNGDGKVNLADFSILLFNWTG